MASPEVVEQHVRFSKKQIAGAEREFFECGICRATGRDEPALGKTAREQAEAHFDKVAAHFRAVAFVVPKEARRNELFAWMKEELSRYGQSEVSAWLGAQVADSYYAPQLRDRDDKIKALTQELEALKRK